MKKNIEHIREPLAKLETESSTKEVNSFERNYSTLELRTVKSAVADFSRFVPSKPVLYLYLYLYLFATEP